MANELSPENSISVGDIVWMPQLRDSTFLINDVAEAPFFVQEILVNADGEARLAFGGTLPERVSRFYVLGHWSLEQILEVHARSVPGGGSEAIKAIIASRYEQPAWQFTG